MIRSMSNQIDVERRGHVGVDVAQEGEGFLVFRHSTISG